MLRVVGINPAMDRTLTIPEFRINDINRATTVTAVAGGKGLDVARTIKRLGGEVATYGFLGGSIGRFIREECERLNIIDRHVEILSETRVCDILVHSSGNATVINEPGPNISQNEVQQILDSLIHDCQTNDIVILSGSLPPGVKENFYSEIIDSLRPIGCRIIVDSSDLVLKLAVNACPWMIKTNLSEFSSVIGRTLSMTNQKEIVAEMQYIVNSGIPIVAVTLGGSGMVVVTRECSFNVNVPDVEVVNPIASGDTFLGGFAFKYLQNKDVKEAARFGSACAVANVMNKSPEIPEGIDLDQLYEDVIINEKGGVKDEVSRN